MKNNFYLFLGESEYLINQEIKKLLSELKVDEFSTISYDMEEALMDDLLEEARTIPFLDEYKVIIIKKSAVLLKSKDMLDLINYLKNPSPTTIMIFDGCGMILEQANELAKMFKLICVIKDVKEFTNFDSYIRKKVQEANAKIDDDAVALLLERCSERGNLDREIEKLTTYAYERLITKEMVNDLTERSLEDNVFELTNALLRNDRHKVMSIYYDLLDSSEDQIRIMNVIVNKFSEILDTKILLNQKYSKEQIAEYFKVSSGRAYYMIKNANDISIVTVKKAMIELAELDYKIKSGKIDKAIGLELFLLKTGER